MPSPLSSAWLCLAMICMAPCRMPGAAASAPPQPAAAPRIEPGLENAIRWKWWVVPSDEKDWGIPLPEPEAPKPATQPGGPLSPTLTITTARITERPATYEVKKGDALILIAKKFDMKVAQLKIFNGMSDDKLKIGQVLRIPTPEELKVLQPPPPPPEPEKKAEEPKAEDKKSKKKKKADESKPELSPEVVKEMDNVLVQTFLDRENFSVGPIDGKSGATLLKVSQLYQGSHAGVVSTDELKAKAKSVLGNPYSSYSMKAEDFRFIAPPKAVPAADGDRKSVKASTKGKSSSSKDAPPPPLTYDELVASTFLAYLTPWEFVAERFHCDEAFLRKINHNLKGKIFVGTEFKVPNVIPFEIEKPFGSPLQPAANPDKPVIASVVEMSRLEISEGGTLIAVMPLASAHPDLRGRGSWTILDVIPHPRMATRHEVKEVVKPKVGANLLGSEAETAIPTATAVPLPPLEHDQYLASGPDNPVGVLWINLAKPKSTEPLPYGLHGTSIPAHMSSQRGIGGLRLTNWNIARAVHLLPPGTPLQWKQH